MIFELSDLCNLDEHHRQLHHTSSTLDWNEYSNILNNEKSVERSTSFRTILRIKRPSTK